MAVTLSGFTEDLPPQLLGTLWNIKIQLLFFHLKIFFLVAAHLWPQNSPPLSRAAALLRDELCG